MNMIDRVGGDIEYGRAKEFFKLEEYKQEVKELILKSIDDDPTLVLHTDEEIKEKFEDSYVAVEGKKLVGNMNIYNTKIDLFHTLGGNVGECGSIVVDKEYRNHGIGNNLVTKGIQELGKDFEVLIAATISQTMEHIAGGLKFKYQKFPQQYYNEGLKYIGPKVKGGVKEFERRAKFMIKFNNKKYYEAVLDLLHNQ